VGEGVWGEEQSSRV
jgi:hypothetical protein